jgi:AcrR family transcriptional regulator
MIEATDSQKPSAVDETRRRILCAARELWCAKGTRGTTTREVAERAGVNEATLFRHFGTKQALVEATIEHFGSVDEMNSAIAQITGPPDVALRELGRNLMEMMTIKREMIVRALTEPEATDAAMKIPRQRLLLVSNFFRRYVDAGELNGDPEVLARFFYGTLVARVLMQRKWDLDEPVTDEEFVRTWVHLFLNGAKRK